jgi:hypothetical protein
VRSFQPAPVERADPVGLRPHQEDQHHEAEHDRVAAIHMTAPPAQVGRRGY